MNFDIFVYPSPKPSYDAESLDKLLWIPKTFPAQKGKNLRRKYKLGKRLVIKSMLEPSLYKLPNQQNQFIPCNFQEYIEGSDMIIISFHGNAEDLGYAYELNELLKVHILAIEYPGYGVYKGKPSEENILRDAEIVYDYLVDYLEIKESQIIILGKSLGTGPSTHLAAHRNPRALILVTPYTSIRECVGDLMGFLSKYLIAERFRNIDKIGKVQCPVCFLHGKKDNIVPYQHSLKLGEKTRFPFFHISEEMQHNQFDLFEDFINPIQIEITTSNVSFVNPQAQKELFINQ